MESMTQVIVAPIVRHGMTIAAGALVTAGLVDPSLQGHFVTIGSGLVLGLLGMAWSLKNAKNNKK